MKQLQLFGVLAAFAALAACGGSEREPASTPTTGTTTETAPATEPAPVEGTVETVTETVEETTTEVVEAAEDVVTADAGTDATTFVIAGLTGNAEAGARVWLQCRTCHELAEGQNRTGPSLYGIFGRTAGTVEGFRYSDANANSGIVWTKDVMFEYLENPRQYIPGTFMSFPGLRQPQQRADVLAYMAANGGLGSAE